MLSGIELDDYLVKAEIQSDDYDYDDMDINNDSRDKWIKQEIEMFILHIRFLLQPLPNSFDDFLKIISGQYI